MTRTLLALLIALPLAVACNAGQSVAPPPEAKLVKTGSAPPVAFVEVTTTAGQFTLQLDGAAAPLTVAHFLKNVDSGFYTGTVFHRIIPGFMIQGGGYDEDYKLRETGETIPNEAGNGLANRRTTIAMARTMDPHSANTQFYINVVDNTSDNPRTANLDPIKSGPGARWGYTVFGYVVDGMETVDLIAQYETENNGPGGAPAPIIPVVIESMKRVSR